MRILTLLLAGCLSMPAFADWQLDNDNSRLSFISTKKSDIAEVHHFQQLTGKLTSTGEITFNINLASVDTLIPIRNQRMQEFLFETGSFPEATFTGEFDSKKLAGLKVGQQVLVSAKGELSLHGKKQSMIAELMVAKLAGHNLMVASYKPLVLNAQQYELAQGVNKLREIANLPTISNAVPVSFVLTFSAEK